MDPEEFKRIKDGNEASVFPDRTILKLCAEVEAARRTAEYWKTNYNARNLQNDEMLAALIALADRVSVRFGEVIKYEPVATGRYLDAAYEVIGKAKSEKPKSESPLCGAQVNCHGGTCGNLKPCDDHAEKRNDEPKVVGENQHSRSGLCWCSRFHDM